MNSISFENGDNPATALLKGSSKVQTVQKVGQAQRYYVVFYMGFDYA